MEFGETFDRPMLESLHQRFCDLYFRHTPDDDGGGKGSSPKEDGGSKKKHKKKKKRKKSKGRNDVDPADRTLGLDDFLVQPEFIHNPLRHRMVAGFEFEGDPVAIDLRAFIRAFCTLAEGAPRDEKLRFAFRVHDVDGDGRVSFDDMLATLRSTILFDPAVHSPEQQEEILREVALNTMAESDEDHDALNGHLSYSEFQQIVRETEFEDKLTVYFQRPVVILQRTFSRLDALLCTAMAWIFIPAYCFVIP